MNICYINLVMGIKLMYGKRNDIAILNLNI